MAVTHFEQAFSLDLEFGHLHARWTMLGEAAGCQAVGVRRIEVAPGGWSTPAHEHGRSEEIFYVLAGSGLSWHNGNTAEIRAGDAILFAPRSGTHSIHAVDGPVDLLAYGTRDYDEAPRFPQLGIALIGGRAVQTTGADGPGPIQFQRESEHGPPPLPPAPGPRPPTIANVDDLQARTVERQAVVRTRRNLGDAIGSRRSGLQHVTVAPGKESAPLHCHSTEEEIFVILDGEGVLVLDDSEQTPVGPGHVISRPAGTGVAHLFRAGAGELTYLAYGTRDNADICYYPRSNKLNFGGVRVIARLDRLDYWDGED